MTSMTIRRIDDHLKQQLRIRAAQHGRSMEEEARDILRCTLSQQPAQPSSLVDSIRAKVTPIGGIDLPAPRRDPIRKPPDFSA